MPENEQCQQEVPVTPGPSRVFIKKVANGFVLEVGCKILVAKTWEEASEGLSLYWTDPVAAEKKYCK